MISNAANILLDPLRRLKQDWQRARSERKLVDSADVLFCSFPKSGRTWVRHILGKLFQQGFRLPEDADCLELENLPLLHPGIPKILFVHDDEPFWKTPEQLSARKRGFRRKKVILLVRHPADVLVSGWFEKTKRYAVHGSPKPAFEGTLGEYAYSERGSAATLIRYLNTWAKERTRLPRFHLLRYEDLHEDAFREIQKIVEFLELAHLLDASMVQAAIESSTFEKMRKLEEKDACRSFRLRPGNVLDPESYKTRQGKVGGYRLYLQAAEIEHLARKVNLELDKGFGYSM